MTYRTIISTILALLLTTSAWAGIQPGTFTLSPMAGGHIFDNDQNLDDSSFWSIGLGYNLSKHAALEAVYSRTNADGETAAFSDAKVQTYRLDALYHFLPEQSLVPYLAVGFGGIIINPDTGSSSEHLLANLGAGVKYFLNDFFALRADVRYLLDFPEPDNNLLYSAGLVFQFGTPDAPPTPIILPKPAPTLAPAPAPLSAPAPLPPKDGDADGVIDGQDQCPETPQGAMVNRRGCALDSDTDGVPDYRDNCPDTPQGVSVDTKGCPTKLTLHINFSLDSDQIGPAFDGEIAKAARCINDFPGNIVFIDGHTDSQGAAEYNQQLSERRALAVKKRLIEKFNISASRLTTRGFGETLPIADNSSKEGRFQNRRVDVACGATE